MRIGILIFIFIFISYGSEGAVQAHAFGISCKESNKGNVKSLIIIFDFQSPIVRMVYYDFFVGKGIVTGKVIGGGHFRNGKVVTSVLKVRGKIAHLWLAKSKNKSFLKYKRKLEGKIVIPIYGKMKYLALSKGSGKGVEYARIICNK